MNSNQIPNEANKGKSIFYEEDLKLNKNLSLLH
jgi:hypothetical protein